MLNEHDIKDFKDVQGKQPSANDTQIGGEHYKQFKGLEPWDVITYWNLGYLDGTALKYIARWKHKNGVEDLKKAIHFLQKTIEVYEQQSKTNLGNTGCGKSGCVHGTCEQSCKSGQQNDGTQTSQVLG